MLDFSLLTLI